MPFLRLSKPKPIPTCNNISFRTTKDLVLEKSHLAKEMKQNVGIRHKSKHNDFGYYCERPLKLQKMLKFIKIVELSKPFEEKIKFKWKYVYLKRYMVIWQQ
jgi:hypothetical protein